MSAYLDMKSQPRCTALRYSLYETKWEGGKETRLLPQCPPRAFVASPACLTQWGELSWAFSSLSQRSTSVAAAAAAAAAALNWLTLVDRLPNARSSKRRWRRRRRRRRRRRDRGRSERRRWKGGTATAECQMFWLAEPQSFLRTYVHT